MHPQAHPCPEGNSTQGEHPMSALKKGCAQSSYKAMAGPWDPTGGPKRIPTPPCPAPQHKTIRVQWASQLGTSTAQPRLHPGHSHGISVTTSKCLPPFPLILPLEPPLLKKLLWLPLPLGSSGPRVPFLAMGPAQAAAGSEHSRLLHRAHASALPPGSPWAQGCPRLPQTPC